MRDGDNNCVPLRIDQQDPLSILSFTAIREGKYELLISFAGNSLPNMPIQIIASSVPAEPSIVEVQGRGSHEARVNEKSEFTVDTSQTPSQESIKPIIRLTDGQTNIDVRIRPIEKNKHNFLCSYKPIIPGRIVRSKKVLFYIYFFSGIYFLSIIWKGQEIRGSPFKVNVLPNINLNHLASQVICSGDGLRMGILGNEMKCLIDTRTANPGELTVYCQGITKTAFCRLVDHRDGTFTLFIKPEEIGRHLLTIKYNDQDVPGSPYTVKVSAPSDSREY
jgi:filamin